MQCICASNAVFIQKVFSIYYSTTLLLSKFSMFWTRAQERQLRKQPRGQFAVYELGSIFSSNCITPKQTKGFNLYGLGKYVLAERQIWILPHPSMDNAHHLSRCSLQIREQKYQVDHVLRGKDIIKMFPPGPIWWTLDFTCGQASEMWTPLASVDSHSV